jgi:transposase
MNQWGELNRRFVMGRALALRDDFHGSDLRRLARLSKDAGQSRRLLALAEIYDGGKRKDAARIGDVGLQVVRDWVLRFNGKGPDGLIDGKSTGQPCKLNDEQRQSLAVLVEAGPIPAIHGVVRWRRADLVQWIFQEYGLSLEVSSVGRELRALGFVKLSPRPRHHGQNEFAVEAFKKTSPPIWQRSGQNCPPARR